MALEEFLKQVRETWQLYELDLVNYQNKCKLIRGWDDLFNKLKENINQVCIDKDVSANKRDRGIIKCFSVPYRLQP